MRITFVLPWYQAQPVGAYVTVYGYAHHLAARGHVVHVIHAGDLEPEDPSKTWVHCDPRVRMLFRVNHARDVPKADFFVTLGYAGSIPPEYGEQIVLVVGYGVLRSTKADDAAWLTPTRKIMIARWMYDRAIEIGVRPEQKVVIPNAVDHDIHRVLRPINERGPRVAMLHSPLLVKGAREGILALEQARKLMPKLEAVLFGVQARPEDLPEWIEYRENPPRTELVDDVYNRSAVFLCSGKREGFHLPSLEAMACGCVLVSSNVGAVREFAEHEVTALLSPPVRPHRLARDILRVVRDMPLRLRLASAGVARARQFTWDRCVDQFEQFLGGHPSPAPL
jgi:glycosyltransferase involved in cell wall biosynthesis